MTQSQFNKAIELNGKLEALELAKIKIEDARTPRLAYVDEEYKIWAPIDCMDSIREILDRHDIQIREEIDREIAAVYKEIEMI